ncbi:hypothetical protein Hanom_Chr11g00998701 [Helianthus anomalus]
MFVPSKQQCNCPNNSRNRKHNPNNSFRWLTAWWSPWWCCPSASWRRWFCSRGYRSLSHVIFFQNRVRSLRRWHHLRCHERE